MTSPLLVYANALLLIKSEAIPEIVNGRVVTEVASRYLVQCFLKRQQSKGTDTGADYPGSNIMPGVSGDSYLYRGYALRYATISSTYDLESDVLPTTWTILTSKAKPLWLTDGVTCEHKQGFEQIKHCIIERSSGTYGGSNIDELISHEISGIPIIVRSGDVMN